MHTLARLSSLAALLSLPFLSIAQRPAPRIRGPIEAAPSVALAGSLDPHLRTAEDLGPLAPETTIPGVTLVFNRSAAQQADLDQLLAAQTNPASPLFHQWLTPGEFADRFDVAPSDIAATHTWLASLGFAITAVSRDRITFSGTAQQIQQAFGAELHHFRSHHGNQPELHFAPASELSLPPALAPLTAAVLHLSDFRPKPSVRPQPQYTTLGAQSHFLAPKDLYSMYDLGNFFSQNHGITGQGLAIVGQSFVNTGVGSAIQNFHSATGSGAIISTVIVPGSGNEAIFPGDLGESEIDLEYSSSLATDGNLFFVYTGSSGNYDVFDALAFAITNDVAPVISISYGVCETLITPSVLQQYNAILQQASAQGQTVVASSGDWGATACAPEDSSTGLSTTQQQALAVSFPASSPYVTAVGGTQMAPGTFAAGTSNYWAAAFSSDDAQSLLSYVPEVAWNESSTSYGIMASGGGASSIFPRPSWQTGVSGIPAGSFRVIPDIALQASVASPGYIICSDDPYLVGSATDCSTGSLKANTGSYIISGGTSFGAPIFAALLSELNRYEMTTGFGNINPILYSLAAQPSVYVSAFHDIASGTTACAIGDGNCGTPGTSGYAATAGYDMATGLGSLDFANLANAWPTRSSNGAVGTWLQVSGIPQTANPGASSAVTIGVEIGCGLCTPPAPTGSVSISVDDGAAVAATLVPPAYPVPLTASATLNFVAPSTTGSHVVVVRYPGDAYHVASTTTLSVLVGNVIPSGSFTLSANSAIMSLDSTTSTKITITPAGGYSGSLTWSAGFTGIPPSENVCYVVDRVPVNGATSATMQIGMGSTCGSAPTAARAPSFVQRSSVLPPQHLSHRTPAMAAVLAFLLCGLFPSRRTRRLLPILSTSMLAVIALTLTGCGGGSGGIGGGPNPSPQTYTLSLTAHDSVNPSITASTSFTLTVE